MSSTSATGIEATFGLTPLQVAMLAQAVRTPGIGLDVGQVVVGMPEAVEPGAMRAAWQRATDAHEALRTAYAWDGLDAPQSVVHAQVTAPVAVLDWRALPAGEQEARFTAWLRADRLRGFDLAEPAHWRATIIQRGPAFSQVVFSLHHSLLDGRCFPVLFGEVWADYEALRDGQPLAERPRSPGMANFVRWHAERDPAPSDAFWRATLGTMTHPTPLPIARAVADQGRAVQGDAETWMDAAGVDALRALATREQVALSTIVQAAWALLLARYAGEEDVTFGVTRAGRKGTVPEAEQVIGLFINTVPLRVAVPAGATLGDWLRAVRRGWDALRDHEHAPPARIQAASGVGAGQLLFDSIVMFERYELEAVMQRMGGAWAQRTVRLHEQNAFGLTLAAYADERMLLRVVYDARRFDADVVARLLRHLEALLRQLAAAPADATLDGFALLDAAERAELEALWTGPVVAREPETLASAVAAQAARTPGAIALRDARTQLTYAEFQSAVDALARRLRAEGVGAGTLVGVAAERSVELAIALHAVVRAGGAWVPVDPEYPRDRVQFMLEDSGVPIVLATGAVAATLPAGGARVLLLDGVAEARDAGPALPWPAPDDTAYMIYTSGSTGRPKGARNAHRGIINRLRWMQEAYQLGAADVVLQKTPFSFDVSVWEFFWPLMTGARLVMAPPGLHKDARALAELVAAEQVTTIHFVPSMLRAFVAEPAARGCRTLRHVVASGEALTGDVVAQLYAALPQARLHNLYGPTECAVDVSHWTCPPDTAPTAVVPIGRPVANTRLYVLDPAGRPCPIGVPGELVLAGVQVGEGYHARPELTADRFLPDPFAPEAERARGARMYRSGDLARWRADGTVEYLGRLDFQVKVRGFRIELGEIEAAMTAHPQVAEAVVSAVDGAGGEKRLVAWAVARGAAPATAELRTFLKGTLPEYMVPAQVMWLPALPLSSNGKVDRRALPKPVAEAGDRAIVEPRTEAEGIIAGIWRDVLRLGAVSVEDDFFEVGGDSLLAIQVVARAARAGLALSLTEALRHPTVAGMARAARRSQRALAIDDAPSAPGAAIPLLPVQQWFARLDPAEPAHWNQAFLFEVPATLDAEALARAVAGVAARHEAFRLRFTRGGDGTWAQHVGEEAAFAFGTVTLEGERAAAIARVADAEARALDLASGPLARACLMVHAGAPVRLLLVLHHLIVDGVSWRVLLEDLDQAYAQAVAGVPVSLPRATSAAAWARAVAHEAASARTQAEAAWWQERLALPARALPVADAAVPNVEGEVAFARATLDAARTQALLTRIPARYGTRVNDALLAALAAALAPWLGEGHVRVDLEGHGREDLGLDVARSIGWFTTIFPVVLPLGTATAPRDRLLAVKDAQRALPRNGLGFGLLAQGAAAPAWAGARADLLFNYLGAFEQAVSAGATFTPAPEDAGPMRAAAARRSHELEVIAELKGGALEVRIGHVPGRHDGAAVSGLASAFIDALGALVAMAEAPGAGAHSPSDFPLVALTQGEVDALAGAGRALEDVLPLTPMQQLFLDSAGGAADPGVQQYGFTLRGTVDRAALRAAWQAVVDATPALRTRFVTAPRPLQVVEGAGRPVPWDEVAPPAGLDAAARAAWLRTWLAADRARGVELAAAPAMRVSLVALAPDETLLVWTHHHIILDRWSWPLVLRQVGAQYEARRVGVAAPALASPPLREAIAALTAAPDAAAERYWRDETAGMAGAARLLGAPVGDLAAPAAWIDEAVALDAAETAQIAAAWRARGVALNTVVQGAWALAVARVRGTADVVLGLTVAGRGLAIPQVEDVVGVLINNVPARVRLDAGQPAAAWLGALQARQVELRAVEHVPLAQVQQWSGLPWGQRLFEALVVFQDASQEAGLSGWFGPALTLAATHTPTETAYPLTLLVTGDRALTVTLRADARWLRPDQVAELARQLGAALRALAGAADATVGALLAALPAAAWTDAAGTRGEHVAPRDALEWVLARQWGEVLGRADVGVTDSLFALGGSSLAATQLVARARERFRVELPMRALFEAPTIEGVARALVARERAPGQVRRIAELVQQVEGMSAEQLRAAAARSSSATTRGVAS
jgi:amino acid adenylation domain-containing protein/non-ribosomal peptide synthase protein (TIGR01720 family)